MINKRNIHLAYYLLLTVFLSISLLFYYRNVGLPDAQYRIVLVSSVGYFIWGMLFHAAKGDLHRKIVIEYLLIAVLSVVLFRGVIF